MSSTTKTLTFLGATGGCAGYCLTHALSSGYQCIALARTPAKLTKSLLEKGVSSDVLDKHLTIVPGNAKDIASVKKALQTSDGNLVDMIISGIGGTPGLQWSFFHPVIINEGEICLDVGSTVLAAAQELAAEQKSKRLPLFINVSTTGIPPPGAPRDVPLLFVPFYLWFLSAPHDDKMKLEAKLREHMALPESQRGIGGFVNVKASLLMDGDAVGLEKVREGSDFKPAVGYTIRRADVGTWIFERLVQGSPKPEWLGGSATVTY